MSTVPAIRIELDDYGTANRLTDLRRTQGRLIRRYRCGQCSSQSDLARGDGRRARGRDGQVWQLPASTYRNVTCRGYAMTRAAFNG